MNKSQISQSFDDFKKLSPTFTGERYTIGAGIRIAYEHFNRYCFALSNISENDIVLDLACGSGYGSILLAQKAKKVISVDIDSQSLELLNAVCQRNDINNIEARCGSVLELEKVLEGLEEKITFIVCHELIEHIGEDQQKVLVSEISNNKSLFTQDCKFLVSTPEKNIYNLINVAHNEFHLKELTREEFTTLLSSNFKHAKFFWQMPVSGDLIAPLDSSKQGSEALSFINWTDVNSIVGFPTNEVGSGLSGIYMYAVCSNASFELDSDLSILVDPINRELQERFVIAAEELRQIKQSIYQARENKELASLSSAENKISEASSKKIKKLIFEAEKIAGEKILLEKKVFQLEQELNKLKPISTNIPDGLLNRIKMEPQLVSEAISYFDLRYRFAHRLGNFILFKLQRKKPLVLLNRFYKYVRLIFAS